jgi:hypothetical protein
MAFAVAVGVLLSSHAAEAQVELTQKYTPDQLQAFCAANHGTYSPPPFPYTGLAPNDTYSCLLPSRTQISCGLLDLVDGGGGFFGSLNFIYDNCVQGQLGPAPFSGLVVNAELLSSEQQIASAQQGISGQLQTLSTAVQSILAGQTALTQQVSNLQAQCTLPDLVPLPVGAAGLSRCDGTTQLHIFVDNQGGGAAPASATQVYFRVPAGSEGALPCGSGCAEVDAPTVNLPGFAGVDLTVAIPSVCYGIDNICQFKIMVDGLLTVLESNESNNTGAGQCVGPIF